MQWKADFSSHGAEREFLIQTCLARIPFGLKNNSFGLEPEIITVRVLDGAHLHTESKCPRKYFLQFYDCMVCSKNANLPSMVPFDN